MLIDIIAGQQLFFIKPASNAAILKCVVEAASELLIVMVIADKARIVLNGFCASGVSDTIDNVGNLSGVQIRSVKVHQLQFPITETTFLKEGFGNISS